MAGDMLPFSARHLHPCVGPALINIEWLSRRIGTLSFEAARRNGGIAKRCYFHIF